MLDTLITGGTVVTPEAAKPIAVGLLDGRIETLGMHHVEAREVVDASGCLVLPGCIDPHVHFQPKLPDENSSDTFIEWADDFTSGSISAACGGVTTFIDFAVQGPKPGDRVTDAVDLYMDVASQTAAVDYAMHAGLTQACQESLDEVPNLVSRGITSFKLFRTYRKWGIFTDLGFMNDLFPLLSSLGATAAVHCEDDEIITYLRNKYISAGLDRDLWYHVLSRPPVAEEVSIDQVAAVARVHGTRAYPVHVSSKRGLEAVRRSRNAGLVASEVGLHFLIIDDEVCKGHDAPLFFMTPPLRPREDIEALWGGLADGSIDWVGTDHSPHMAQEKRADPRFSPSTDGLEFAIPPGFTGIEEMLPLVYTYGVAAGRFTLSRLVSVLSTSAAQTLGLTDKGAIAVGKDADLVIYDPQHERKITISDLHTQSDYTIYEGVPVMGRVRDTFSRGRRIVKDGEYVGRPGDGQFVRRVTQ